jgi:hypothetical protein
MLFIGISLLALGALVWLFLVASLRSMWASDAAGNGLAQAYIAVTILVLWGVLAVSLVVAGCRGAVPWWGKVGAVVLMPGSLAGAIAAFSVLTKRESPRWVMVVPIGLPAVWMGVGGLALANEAAGPRGSLVLAVMLGAIGLLSIAAVPRCLARHASRRRSSKGPVHVKEE